MVRDCAHNLTVCMDARVGAWGAFHMLSHTVTGLILSCRGRDAGCMGPPYVCVCEGVMSMDHMYGNWWESILLAGLLEYRVHV
jgi:hypothetical protein